MAQVEELRTSWIRQIPSVRPEFPLLRPLTLLTPPDGTGVAEPDVAGFTGRVITFLDRWGLSSLSDWHLPVPQGPHLPSDLPVGAPAEPTHGIRLIVPVHYPVLGDDYLLRRIAHLQREAARSTGIPITLCPVRRHKQHARMFRLHHLEIAIRSRFGVPAPRGLASAIEAAAVTLGVSTDTTKRLRKRIKACLAGRRSHTGLREGTE